MPQGLGSSNGQSRARLSGAAPGQPALSPLGVQFFSSLEGLEIASSTDRQLIRGHNLIGAVRLQFVKASFFDGGAGEHGEVLDEIDGIDVPLSMHVYPFPQADEWENQWFFFDIQLHPYQLYFRRRVEDGEESIIGGWEDLYAKLAQVRGQMCLQAISIRPLRLANDCLPTIAPRATFHGPVDTTAFRFKAGSLSNNQLKCCGFIQCSTYLVPPRDKDPTFRGGQMFHILAYMPHDKQPWKSRVDWMKGLPEGGFASGKWMYGRGSIVGVLNPALLQEELQPGQDILVVLVDEFSFTSKVTLEGATVMRKASSPQKAKVDLAKRRNPFSSKHKGVRYWLCRLCHEKRSYSTALYASSGTAHAARHLLRQHQIAEFGDSSPSLTTPFTLAAASASSSVRPLSRQASLGFQLGSHFDERSWKARFVDWIILEDVTFRQASSERLRWLIANGGELASQLLPEHHTTVCSWIRLTFESRRQIIFNLVKDAKSSVHLSFDLWTASNGFHYIGIVGHFVDSEGEKRDVLLGLPRLVGPHSGENMASYVKEVINQYEMGSKLGYFMLDNAESNDTCLETLARWFPMDVSRRRLRCIGHIINLVVRAVIFGSNVSKFEAELRGATDEFSFEIWAKKGAVGRLHNLATYIRRTDQRRQALRRLQTELAGDDAIFTLEIVVDGKTRWNSIYVMIKRGMRICLSLTSVEHLLTWDRLILALELRSAIELYQSRWQKPKNDPVHRDLTKDFLSAVDWAELERFHDFLKPFYILTKTMEGNASKPGTEGGHGAVWETLKTMDYLFVKFKQAAEETQFEEPSHFKSGIDCGWAKLEDYYIKTDRTPIYRAALALHPSYGYDYFERHWKNAMDRPQWYSDMQSAVGSLFDEYVRQAELIWEEVNPLIAYTTKEGQGS
ncbi:Zinc finger BED domain-containing protein RICESLEEPER 2 [Fusarium oxysporum f. sp. raphani]|uniref:Zinc finger BED domain-containing protein RICESLEEPER 2 n=1 Tax=Fusarium oxysporum f. sp. raphani TaxID=96318 RepID=A0A8J5PGM5_FUSOX|nr:Zinc finger BED domain-containing protein RICESLEEPER 2 [Fusarium oxysporum f. sp. raphani]